MSFLVLLYCLVFLITRSLSADHDMSTSELIIKYKFPLEIYSNVTTEDGYLLDIFRIPSRKKRSTPILLMHGLIGSARNFVSNGLNESLAFILSSKGHDVWMGDVRGSSSSRKHPVYNPDTDPKFWEFSMHEIGIYDIPAILDKIKNVTGHSKVVYIGHSQGSTIYYILNSYRPEYNSRFALTISLAPAVYMNHMYNPLYRFLAPMEQTLTEYFVSSKMVEFPPANIHKLLQTANRMFCAREGDLREVCGYLLHIMGGYSPRQLNESRLATYFGDGLSTFSIHQMMHYAQNFNSAKFKAYDWHSPQKNLERYGTEQVPEYNVSKVISPIAIFYSENDWLVNKTDVMRLIDNLPNCIFARTVADSEFNHFDFLFAIDVVKLVYEDIVKLLRKF